MTDTAQTSATTTTISQSDVQSLERFYTVRDETEVLQLLEKYPFLIAPLLEAPNKIHRYFPNEQLLLEVVPDPEIIDYVQLVISILTHIEPHEAMAREDQLDADWWYGLSHQVREQLCVLLTYP